MGIRLLPEGVWARIAAGEVVERPASAVKEMAENSLDAGARRVRVRLWDGGRVRVVVEDDGAGIAFEELPLALAPHATSKIGGIEDLDAIRTLGYRGEALASLAAVGRVEIRSRPAGAELGGVIHAYEGKIFEHQRVNCVPGTRVQVDEIFANLPARRKFLKSAAGELRRAAAVLREYAICRPEVGFSLEHDGRPVFSTDGSGDRRRAVQRLWGGEPEILTARASAGSVELECWWQPRPGRNEVSAFVNGRSVSDPLIKGAVGAIRELVGGWALFFTVDPSLTDVNIHPAKAEVRFRHPSEVFESVKVAASQLGAAARPGGPDFSAPHFQEVPPVRTFGNSRQAFPQSDGPPASRSAAFQVHRPERLFGRIEAPDGPSPAQKESSKGLGENALGNPLAEDAPDWPPSTAGGREEAAPVPTDVAYLGQSNMGYLVFDVLGSEGGLVLVDPHAAHERVAFERVRAAAKEGARSQKLLLPAPLPPTLLLEVEEKKAFLEGIGFTLEFFDGGEMRLTATPCLPGVSIPPEVLLRSSLAAFRDGEPANASEEILWRAWATAACREAVKLTTALSPQEALALWRDLHGCQQPAFCPHGRPTVLTLTRTELTRRFGRA
ncbi:MAG: DNA mismatch repair endonuclease MutL [Synergistaceae bacterium]|jgi:DNA mismatch repair protein MutL|nr:DNA mismatch repair endonuclease MutL [Synergistaceae bacterium]